MARRRFNTTKYEIIQVATKLFLDIGYSATPPKLVCETLDISTGNLTYYFPTKEHLLAVLVEMLCDFQQESVDKATEDGQTSLFSVCMELATMAAMSEDNPIAKDLFVSAYSSPMCLEIIRKNDSARSKQVYGPYCAGWTQEQFDQAEILVSGVEFATMMAAGGNVTLEARITGALDNIMGIYGVPEAVRKQKIEKVLSMDYRNLGCLVLDDFKDFVERTNEHAVQGLRLQKAD